MSIAWTCVLIERNPTTGVETETAVPVDQEQIVLHGRETFVPVPLAWRNRLTTEQCLRRLLFGWRDTGTLAWVQDNELFGGYVIRTTHKKDGGETTFGLYCQDYDILFDRVTVRGYPGDPLYTDPFGTLPHTVREYHIPVALGDVAVDGYPIGQSPATWIGGTPGSGIPDGLLPTFFASNISIGSIDAAFSAVTFDLTARPTNTAILGHLEGLTIRGALEVILACNGLLQPNVKPWYFMRPLAAGADVKPEFMLVDLNGTLTADWSFDDANTSTVRWASSDAPGTIYSYGADFTYERDASNLRTQVTVFGVGSSYKRTSGTDVYYQRVIGEWPTGTDIALYQDPYPTKYPVIPGWGGEPIITDISGNSHSYPPHQIADQIANLIGHAMSKPAERITFTTYVPVKKGQIIHVADTTTGVDANYPVLDVTGGGVLREYRVTAGYEPPTMQDILSGPRMQLWKLAALGIVRNASGRGPNFYNPNVPGGGVPTRASSNNEQNAVASVVDTVSAISPQGATNVSKVTPDGMPIGTSTDNYLASPLVDPPLRPTPGTDVFPTPRYYTREAASPYAISEWDWDDGYNHPWHQHFEFDEPGKSDVFYPTRVVISTVAVVREYDDVGNRVFPISGGACSVSRTQVCRTLNRAA
jgi:hypothetical protein